AGRALDDYGTAVIRYTNGALGTVTASQISHGRENDLWIEVDGTKAAIEWHQEEPNKMLVRKNGQPHQLYTRAGGPYLGELAALATRLPSGHPEAFLEAFANIYTAAYADMVKRASGQKFDAAASLYPNVADGVDGMNFITQSVSSSAEGGAWKKLKHPLCREGAAAVGPARPLPIHAGQARIKSLPRRANRAEHPAEGSDRPGPQDGPSVQAETRSRLRASQTIHPAWASERFHPEGHPREGREAQPPLRPADADPGHH